MDTLSFSPPVNFTEEGKWLLAVTCFEATNSVYNTLVEKISFSITISGYWFSTGGGSTINKQQKSLELRRQNRMVFHVKQVIKRV